uniref:Oxysterol-binding protein-related protein 2A-like isoform X4 n=1 Tax=Rhizophora mucronata TaxID=61149 RepID=A0A2P2LXD9_RHIMU
MKCQKTCNAEFFLYVVFNCKNSPSVSQSLHIRLY